MAQKLKSGVNNLEPDSVAPSLKECVDGPDHIAFGLLKLQQRFEALDRLYNEEVGKLARDLAQMKADYVRLYQAQSSTRSGGKASRKRASRAQLSS